MEPVSSQNSVVEETTGATGQAAIGQVISADGTVIGYRQVGRGPGLVILHGGVRVGRHYLRLAEALAGSFTVYLPDRRGRGLSGPRGEGYRIEKEMEDVRAVMQKTGAENLFGHSAGGFFALEAAFRLPVRKLALYEPAVSIHGSLPSGWLADYEQALAKNDPAMAFVYLTKGLQVGPPLLNQMPNWALSTLTRLMLRGDDGEEMAALLPSAAWEMREFIRLEQLGVTYARYAHISAQTLLIAGTSSPAYLRDAARTLSQTIPGAKLAELAGLDHNAPDQNAPEQIGAELLRFFA